MSNRESETGLKKLTTAAFAAVVLLTLAPAIPRRETFFAARRTSSGAVASDAAEARSAITQAFARLRGGDYGALWDALPSASQRRIPRERFTGALERARGRVELDRMEIGALNVAGDLAVADTTVYGRVLRPVAGEGKIVSRQYLVREGGRWRVTTGDSSTVRPLLAANPQLARRFPPTEPRIFLKRDGRWIDLSVLTPRGGAQQ